MVEHKGDNKTFRYTVHTVSYEQRGNTKQILPQLVDATGHNVLRRLRLSMPHGKPVICDVDEPLCDTHFRTYSERYFHISDRIAVQA
jgi:hypothetical protein